MSHPFIPLPNGVQVVIQGMLKAQTIENVFYVVLPTAPGPTDVQGVAEDFEVWFRTHMLAHFSHEFTLVQVTATDWTSSSGSQFVFVEPSPVPGSISGPAASNSLAMVLSWHTARRGRSFRGRTFLAGIDLGSTTDEVTWTAAAIAAMDASALLIPGFNVTTPYALVVASFFSGVDSLHKPIPRVTGVGTPINAVTVDSIIMNQRRRRPGRGI